MPDAHDEDNKPQLILHEGDLPASVRILRELLAQSSSLFDRGRVLVEVKRDADGTLFSRPMQLTNVIVLAHEFCQPVVFDRKGNLRPVTLPDRAARMYLELGEWGLQPLAGISTSPLLRRDGTITSTNGYDCHSQLFCDASPAVEVPDSPSEADSRRALAACATHSKPFRLPTPSCSRGQTASRLSDGEPA